MICRETSKILHITLIEKISGRDGGKYKQGVEMPRQCLTLRSKVQHIHLWRVTQTRTSEL